ncbi:MAG: hypothetical protein JRJ60_18465 [Deltaproteobacteria bacterium]|nr:hypothetical protein [Deltaproteobacteria bacterium]
MNVNEAVNPTSSEAANFPANFLDTAAAGTSSVAGAAATIADPAGFTIGFLSQSIGKYILDVELSALQKEKKVEILSSPSITTLDNQTAYIESGRKIPYQTVDRYGNINIKWENAVLRLEVTPHVVAGEILSMKVKVIKDEADFSEPVQGTPTIITRRAETNVVLLDGQTTVIGGLGKDTTANTDEGIPWLMDIPMLSWLFKSNQKAKEMDQLLIFLTPHILKSRDAEIRKAVEGK